MPWSTTRKPGTAAKYRTPAHRNLRAHYVRMIQRDGSVECCAIECALPSRSITNPDGRAEDGLNLGHQDNGIDYRGPEHRKCNILDAARRASARSHGVSETPQPWLL